MMNPDALFSRRILDDLHSAEKQDRLVYTRFLTPAEQADAFAVARRAGWMPLADGMPGYFSYGGFKGAERQRVFFSPYPAEEGDPVQSLLTTSSFSFIEVQYPAIAGPGPGHRDVLGALMNAGIRRDFIGDILSDPAHSRVWIVMDPSITDFIQQSLTRIGRYSVTLIESSVAKFSPPDETGQGILSTGTVASLRLDTVASHAFGLPRAEMADRIRHGDVHVNWVACTDPDHHVKAGDRFSLKGSGKAVLADVSGQSRKGRIFITTERPQ